MMGSRGKNLIIIWFASIGVIVIFSIIAEFVRAANQGQPNEILSLIARILIGIWLIYTLLIIILIIYEVVRIKRSRNKPIDEQINFWITKRGKFFFTALEWDSDLNLGILYLRKNDIDKAKELLAKPMVSVSDAAYYPLFVIAAHENNTEAMNEYYNKLMDIGMKRFDAQKQSATNIKKMIETKEFYQSVYDNTGYQIVKDICIKYKKD